MQRFRFAKAMFKGAHAGDGGGLARACGAFGGRRESQPDQRGRRQTDDPRPCLGVGSHSQPFTARTGLDPIPNHLPPMSIAVADRRIMGKRDKQSRRCSPFPDYNSTH